MSRPRTPRIRLPSVPSGPAVALWVLALASCAGPAEPWDPDIGAEPRAASPKRLRIMTYNTALLSFDVYVALTAIAVSPFSNTFSGVTNYPDRAALLAAAILRAEPDVVALNEVMHDDARLVLIEELEATYPYHITAIGASPVILDDIEDFIPTWLEDIITAILPFYETPKAVRFPSSGLAIFSKYPFLELPSDVRRDYLCSGDGCVLEGMNGANDVKAEDVGFLRYDACSGFDCLASKGVAIVKLDTDGSDTYVAFTHMQADEDGSSYPDVRDLQYDGIDALVRAAVPKAQLESAQVFVVGDMNTPGGNAEWRNRFDPASAGAKAFFACANEPGCDSTRLLTDAWGFETSPTDPGITNGTRLDYVLHGSNSEQCLQHMRIPYEVLDAATGQNWSDHLPVLADLNAPAQWCSSDREHPNTDRAPRELSFGTTSCYGTDCDPDEDIGPSDGAEITYEGSYQWFVVSEAGTYSIKTSDASAATDVAFDVYRHDDLSRPLLPETDIPSRRGLPFAMNNPPYYIRTYVPGDAAADFDYTLAVHQHLCRSVPDACYLDPLDDVVYTWPDHVGPPATVGAEVETIFYRFKTATVARGELVAAGPDAAYPELAFLLEPDQSGCLEQPQLSLVTDLADIDFASDVGDPSDDDWDDDGAQDRRWFAPPLDGLVDGEFTEYLLRVNRTCMGPLTTTTRFETTLTYAEPGTLTCELQAEDSGVAEDDHVRMQWAFDTGGGAAASCESSCTHYATLDEAWPEGLQNAGIATLTDVPGLSGYYVDTLYPNLWEREGDDSDADIEFEIHHVDGMTWTSEGLATLSSTDRSASGRIWFGDDDGEDGDYWYDLEFQLDHHGPMYE
jgi:endonuclease/exonuclease/phosphatase family metal-dependent hydrolase